MAQESLNSQLPETDYTTDQAASKMGTTGDRLIAIVHRLKINPRTIPNRMNRWVFSDADIAYISLALVSERLDSIQNELTAALAEISVLRNDIWKATKFKTVTR
jgi:hypothetical protein